MSCDERLSFPPKHGRLGQKSLQAGMLFTQCVDGRFSIWRDEFVQTGEPIAAFSISLNNPLKRCHEKLLKEREKKLFGQDVPAPVFVQQSR